MSADDKRLTMFIDKRLTHAEPCKLLIISRFSDNTTIETIRVGQKGLDALVDEVRDLCNTDAEGLSGHQRYQIKAIHGENDKPLATLAYFRDGGIREAAVDSPGVMLEDTSPRGAEAMRMRHTDLVFRSSQGSVNNAIRMYEKQIETLSATLERTQQECEQLRRELREIRDEDKEAARQRRKDQWMEEKKDQLFDQILPLVPIAAMGVGKKFFPGLLPPAGAPGVAVPSELETHIRAAFSVMRPEQLHALMSVLDEGQKIALFPVLQMLQAEREQKEARSAERVAESPNGVGT